jgi:hypothetical protein
MEIFVNVAQNWKRGSKTFCGNEFSVCFLHMRSFAASHDEERKAFRANPSVGRIKKIHCKKRLTIFPSPALMSLTKLSLDGK